MSLSRREAMKYFQIIVFAAIIFPCAFSGAGDLKSIEGGKTYGEETLKPAQIKACILFEKTLDSQSSTIKALSDKLDRTEKELHSLKAIVKRGLSSNSRREEIAAYDRKSKQFKETKITYKKDTEKYKNLLQDYREDVDRHNSQCKSKPYYEDDYKAVLNMMK